MPRLYKRTARKNIWKIGFRIAAANKQGFTVNRSIPASTGDNEVPDVLLIPKGSEYYMWHPKGCDWQYSLAKPDLTKPKTEYEEKMDDFNNRISDIEYAEDDDNIDEDEKSQNKDSLREEIEEYQSELQERLDNIPQQLQDSSVLNERIDELQSLIDQLT